MKVVVHVDGGSRGNPGPAAGAAVIRAPNGELLAQASELLGVATNNVAEYRGLLLGLRRASELGATEVELINDSELVAKQLSGLYKVKHPAMRPLHQEAMAALRRRSPHSARSSTGRSARSRGSKTQRPTRSSTPRSTPRAEVRRTPSVQQSPTTTLRRCSALAIESWSAWCRRR